MMNEDRNQQDDGREPAKPDPIVRLDASGATDSTGATSTTDREQPSSLGGDVATRSGTDDKR